MSNPNPLSRPSRLMQLRLSARLKAAVAAFVFTAAVGTVGAAAVFGSTTGTTTSSGNSPQDAQTSEGFDLEATYMRTCFACHSTGLGGAPKVGPGNKADWDARIAAKGMDGMLQSVINGLNTMTPKGLCFECSDEDLRALMDYMVESSTE